MSLIDTDPDAVRAWARKAEKLYAAAEGYGEKRSAKIIQHAVVQYADHANPAFLNALRRMRRTPWTIDEFLESKEFLGGCDPEEALLEIWPNLKNDIREINPDVMIGEAPVHEALLGGATGTGKSVIGQVTTLHQALLLTCFDEPQRLFRKSPAMQIVFLLQAVTLTTVKRAIYSPMLHMWRAMPYVQKWVEYDRRKEGEIDIKSHNIIITPAVPNIQAMIGQAIIGGAWDEINFMSIVEQSKQVAGPSGQGGRWDQAEELHSTVSRRRRSRYMTMGPSFGCLVVSSSTRYEGDYLDRRIAQAEEISEPNIVHKRRKQYEVQPGDSRSGKVFRLLVGCDAYPTQVLLEQGETGFERQIIPDGAQIEEVPVEYINDFKKDPENALRDIVGIATKAITPFITQRHKLVDAVLLGREYGLNAWIAKPNVELAVDGMPQIDEALLPTDLDTPRAVHVDLSETNDRCGIAMVKIVDFVPVIDTDHRGNEITTHYPLYAIEMAVSIQPHPMTPLLPSDVRKWIMQLNQFYGFNIASVTYDGYQSSESVGLFRKAGVRAEYVSVDTSNEPYEYLRTSYYEDRIMSIDNDLLRQELVSLEWTKDRKKIDHPPRGSKDISDAVAGAVFALSQLRSTNARIVAMDHRGERSIIHDKQRAQGGTNRQRGQKVVKK